MQFLNISCWMRWKKKEIKVKMQFSDFFLLNAMKNEENNKVFWMLFLYSMKNEENKGKNAIFWMFLVECDEKWRK
jgi:hypothetical protein